MLKRLLFGLVFGLFVGGLLAAAVVKGMGMVAFGANAGGVVMAYVFAAVTGVLVGLVAGKPIWASGGQIEAGLKAAAGAIVGAAAMFAMRRWLSIDLDFHSMGLGASQAGMLPVVTLPLIAGVLGAFYEADNTPSPDDKDKKAKGKDAPSSKKSNVRVSDSEDEGEDEEIEAPPKKAKK